MNIAVETAKPPRPWRIEAWYRPVMLGLTVLLGAFAVAIAVARFGAFAQLDSLGIDYRTVTGDFAQRWLETGSMYLPNQISGPFAAQPPYVPVAMPSMYPPQAILLFLPFLVLPAFLWWAIPLAILVGVLAYLRPAPWSWPVIALICVWPNTSSVFFAGGTTMWMAAAVALGTVLGWPLLLVLLKPTFAPFALLGIRDRRWWVGAAGLAVLSLVMFPELVRYLSVVRNATGTSLLYSVGDLPLMILPLVARTAAARPTSG